MTTGTWYPPAAGTGGFLADLPLLRNPPFALMPSATQSAAINLPALLAARQSAPDGVILDCLELHNWLSPHLSASEPIRVTSEQLQARWICSQATASRRMDALRRHGLIACSQQLGRGAHWKIRRIGPA